MLSSLGWGQLSPWVTCCSGTAPGVITVQGCVCRDLYQCSCEELDTLVAECKKQGALGSRLTGAGWGGCTVSLIKQSDAAQFITAIKSNYFEKCIKEGKVKSDQLEDVIFASKPASGGAIIKLQV